MPRYVLFPKMEKIRRYDVHAMRTVAGAQADHRHWQRLREIFSNLGRRHFAQYRETARIDHRLGIVDHFLRALGGLALGDETAELRHAHRRNADMSLHRNA